MLKKIKDKIPFMNGKKEEKATPVELIAASMTSIGNMVDKGEINSFEEYMVQRRELNLDIIMAMFGGNVTTNKAGVPSIKFDTRKFINALEFASLNSLVLNYVNDIEKPFLNSLTELSSGKSDDIGIPNSIFDSHEIPDVEKINERQFSDLIFGKEGRNSILNVLIDSQDLVKLLSIGEKVMKSKNVKKTIIIVAGVAAVAAIGYVGYKKYQQHKAEKEAPVEDIDPDDYDDIDPDDYDDIDPDEIVDAE